MAQHRHRSRWAVIDGLRLRVGSWRWRWIRRHQARMVGRSNPARHGRDGPRPEPAPLAAEIVGFAHASLHYAGRMVYTENLYLRRQLYNRRPGDFLGAHADCSQFVAAILHWCKVPVVTETDYTGTLLRKGRLVSGEAPGRVAIFGPGKGDHAAICDGRGYVIGFGRQGAPDRTPLPAMISYFGGSVRFLEFQR